MQPTRCLLIPRCRLKLSWFYCFPIPGKLVFLLLSIAIYTQTLVECDYNWECLKETVALILQDGRLLGVYCPVLYQIYNTHFYHSMLILKWITKKIIHSQFHNSKVFYDTENIPKVWGKNGIWDFLSEVLFSTVDLIFFFSLRIDYIKVYKKRWVLH